MARVVTPNTGIEIQVRGLANVQAMLAKAADTKEGTKYLQRATAAGGKALKPFLVEAAPYPGLKKAVWIHRASRNRPATSVCRPFAARCTSTGCSSPICLIRSASSAM